MLTQNPSLADTPNGQVADPGLVVKMKVVSSKMNTGVDITFGPQPIADTERGCDKDG